MKILLLTENLSSEEVLFFKYLFNCENFYINEIFTKKMKSFLRVYFQFAVFASFCNIK